MNLDKLGPASKAVISLLVVLAFFGCIAPGRAIDSSGARMVTQSALAMADIKRLLPYTNEHTIEVR